MWGDEEEDHFADAYNSPDYGEPDRYHDSDEIDSDIEEALLQQFHYAQHIPGNEDDLAVTTLTEEEANLLKNGGWSELQSVAKQSRKRRKAPAEPEVHKVQKSGDVATSAALGEASSAATVERDNSASDQEIEEESKYAITKRKDPLRNALADISQAGPAKRRRVSTGSSSGSSSDADAASSPPSGVVSDGDEALELPTIVLPKPAAPVSDESSDSSSGSDSEYRDEWHMDDDDPKGAESRYYVGGADAAPEERQKRWGPLCFQCGTRGHTKVACPNAKDAICIKCGKKGHNERACPFEICFNCGQAGHQSRECTIKRRRWEPCNRCNVEGHVADACHELWRQWLFTQKGAHIVSSNDTNPRRYCYVCAKSGHLGHECNERDLHWDRFFLPVPPFVGFYGDKVKFTKHHLKNTARKPDKRYSDMHERQGDRHGGYYDNGAHDRRYPDNNRNWGAPGARSAPGSPYPPPMRYNDNGLHYMQPPQHYRSPQPRDYNQQRDNNQQWSGRQSDSFPRHSQRDQSPIANQSRSSGKGQYKRSRTEHDDRRSSAPPPPTNGPRYKGGYRR